MDDQFYDPELELIGGAHLDDDASAGPNHALRTAPVFTGDALQLLGASVMPQRALYGRVVAQRGHNLTDKPTNPKVYINTNAPFSALVCGVQGSGKSHSTSVLLESCLMSDARLGTLPAPLSALVFHFDTAAGGGVVQPCEAAYLAALDMERGGDATPPTVAVLVLPNNLQAMKRVYAGLPAVKVEPLHFSAEDISGERLLAMMKVDENTQMPLYMEAIMSILRSMESNFDYVRFRDQLKAQKFNPGQKAMLNLRLSLLDSCLQGGTHENRVSTHFRKGQLTIIDLSSPFMDGTSACGFFDLILGLFVEADIDVAGKLIVLDEAHKYLSESQSGTSARLTDSLLTVIRQQRHLATRVVISTQEPTVVPSKFLDLCSFIIAHRFSSPKWLRLLANHVSAADDSFDELFSKIVSLPTGQAIMFAPNGLGVRTATKAATSWGDEGDVDESGPECEVAPIGQGYLHVRSRLRVTRDGGHSILAVSDPDSTTRLGRVHARALARESEETAAVPDSWSIGNDSVNAAGQPGSTVSSSEPVSMPQRDSPSSPSPLPTSSSAKSWAALIAGKPSVKPNPATGPSWASVATDVGVAWPTTPSTWPTTSNTSTPWWPSTSSTNNSAWAPTASAVNELAWSSTTPATWPSAHEDNSAVSRTYNQPAPSTSGPAASRGPRQSSLWSDLHAPDGQVASWSDAGESAASPATSSTATLNLAADSNVLSDPAEPSLTRFKPILDYLLQRQVEFSCATLTIKNIGNHFAETQPRLYGEDIADTIHQAAAQGLLQITTSKRGKERAKLLSKGKALADIPPKASPATSTAGIAATLTHTINLGDKQRFVPLMQHILSARNSGDPSGLSVAGIRAHFVAAAPQIYGSKLKQIKRVCFEAIQQGLLVPGDGIMPSALPQLKTVALRPGARYINY